MEKECKILNELAGDCELADEEGHVYWQCQYLINKEEKNENSN